MAQHDMVPPETHTLMIKMDGAGKWRVDVPSKTVLPGDTVEWRFADRPMQSPPPDLRASFQFTDEQFVDDVAHAKISDDWTCKRPLREDAVFALKIRDTADPLTLVRRFHYAVIITGSNVNPSEAYTGSKDVAWAIGKNPPPEIDIGGR